MTAAEETIVVAGDSPSREQGVCVLGPDEQRHLVDTTKASVLHRVVEFDGTWFPKILWLYLASVALTYVPLLLVAPWSVATNQGTRLPFLLDWNITFTCLASFPMLVILIVTDERVLRRALERVWSSGVFSGGVKDAAEFARAWTSRFRWTNALAYGLGLTLGAGLSWLTLEAYLWSNAGFWAAPTASIGLVGYVYLYCITLLYAVISVFVARSILIAFFLGSLVKRVTLNLLPFHPDGCGGLQPVGQLGLRNQYTLTILGLNIVILGFVTHAYLGPHGAEIYMIVTAVMAYLILGPIVFMGPLIPFRAGMLRSKAALMAELGKRLRAEFDVIRGKLQDEGLSDSDLKALERLEAFGTMTKELPIWPFDARTLRTFGSAYVVPFAFPLLSKLAGSGLEWLGLKV